MDNISRQKKKESSNIIKNYYIDHSLAENCAYLVLS